MYKACWLAFALFLFDARANPSLDLSARDPAFPLLRRVQTKGVFVYPSQNMPQAVKGLKEFLNLGALSNYDSYQLQHRHPLGGTPLVRWNDSVRDHSLYLSPLLFSQYADSGASSLSGGVGLRMYGNIKSYLTYFTRGIVFTEKSSQSIFAHQFDPDDGETCSVEATPGNALLDTRTCARFEYYLLFNLDWFRLKFGRDHLHMGPGYFSNLTANRDTPPYYLAEARIDFADWLVMNNAFLKMVDSDHDIRKWAHIHRFEFKPLKSLSLSFQDIVIYQERDPDPTYFIPLVPLAFAEDNSGGRDNDAMSFDFLFTGAPNLSFWGELFIDDLLGPTAFFDDFWENRWAALAGFQMVSPWPIIDADFVFEYSRVEPWTYVGRQAYTSFKHYNVPSASKLGPNSRSIDMQLSYRPYKLFEIFELIEIMDKGTDPGSDLETIHVDSLHGTTKDFLGGDPIFNSTFTHGARVHWKQFAALEIKVSQAVGGSSQTKFSGSTQISW